MWVTMAVPATSAGDRSVRANSPIVGSTPPGPRAVIPTPPRSPSSPSSARTGSDRPAITAPPRIDRCSRGRTSRQGCTAARRHAGAQRFASSTGHSSHLLYGQQVVAVAGIRLHPAGVAEAELRQDPPRGDVPVPDLRPQPPVACLARPRDHSATRLSRVTAAVGRTQQLVSQLRLVGRPVLLKGQPAVSDDLGRALALHRQNPRPRLRTLGAYLRSDVLHGRSALGTQPPMRRHTRIPLSPQPAIDSGVVHSGRPKDEASGLQRVQNGHERHARSVSGQPTDACTEGYETAGLKSAFRRRTRAEPRAHVRLFEPWRRTPGPGLQGSWAVPTESFAY